MEVLHESLEPALMDAKIQWQPPLGYSIVDSTPKSLGVVYSQQTRLAFAFIKKNSDVQSLSPKMNGYHVDGEPLSPATLKGYLVGGKEVKVPVQQSVLPPLNSQQSQELSHLLSQVGHWSKIEELEILRLQANSRKNSTEEEEEVPHSKRPRLNGMKSALISLPSASELKDDLLRLSLDSGISSSFTYFIGHGESGRSIIQLLPYQRQENAHMSIGRINGIVPHTKRVGDTRKRSSAQQSVREQQKQRSQRQQSSTSSHTSSTSVVASTLSAVGNSFMSMVNNIFQTSSGSLGFEDGKTLEDEMDIQKRKRTQLYWDESRNEIRYPQSYYQSNNKASTTSASTKSSKHLIPAVSNGKAFQSSATTNGHSKPFYHLNAGQSLLTSSSGHPPPPSVLLHPSHSSLPHLSSSAKQSFTSTDTSSSSSSSDDEEDDILNISDSESDSSLDWDWEALPKTREYMPIIQMQLFSGAWPVVRGFSYAIRVPPNEIKLLPLASNRTNKGTAVGKGLSVPRPTSQDMDNAHFWSTALAVVCFRECFPKFEKEWRLIVAKAECWMEKNLDQCGLKMDRVYATAKELLFKNEDN